MAVRTRLVGMLAVLAAFACGPPVAPKVALPNGLVVGEGLPLLARVVREGDPAGAIAAFISTEGIEPSTGAAPAVALAELFARRLANAALVARVTPQADGVRVEVLVAETSATRAATTLRDALLAPVAEAEVDAVRRRLEVLARLPALPGYDEAAWCGGEVLAGTARLDPNVAAIERVRAAAVGRGRVALAAAGAAWAAEAARAALATGPRWPEGAAIPAPPAIDALRVHEDVDPARVRARVTLRTTAAAAARATAALGRDGSSLGARLRAEGAPVTAPVNLARVIATVHAGGAGCVVIDLEGDATAAREGSALGGAIAIARGEATLAVDDARDADLADETARAVREAGDVRDAAARAAAWALASFAGARASEARPGREGGSAPPARSLAAYVSAPAGADTAALRARLEARLARTASGMIEVRAAIERGQGASWVLLASPCGTTSEGAQDAGASALFVSAAAHAVDGQEGVRVEPWYAPDGVGVLAHAARGADESDIAVARRVAEIAARALVVDPLVALTRARAQLLSLVQDAPGLGALGNALAPSHPSWVAPGGTADALLRTADAAVLTRAATLRSGPLRVAILAGDQAATSAAAAVVERWVPHTDATRACPSPAAVPAATPGTYAVPSTGRSEAWLALPLDGAPARSAAPLLAAVLDGSGGALDVAITRGGLARSAGARVLVGPRSALVVHVEAPSAALDTAVAQARALLDRLRKSGPTPAELARARRELAANDLVAALDPRSRAVRLWRGPPEAPPTDEALRSAASAVLRDEALVIVALRPDPRAPSEPRRTP